MIACQSGGYKFTYNFSKIKKIIDAGTITSYMYVVVFPKAIMRLSYPAEFADGLPDYRIVCQRIYVVRNIMKGSINYA